MCAARRSVFRQAGAGFVWARATPSTIQTRKRKKSTINNHQQHMQHRPYQGEDFGQIHLFGRGQPTAGSAFFIRRVIAVDFRLPPPFPFANDIALYLCLQRSVRCARRVPRNATPTRPSSNHNQRAHHTHAIVTQTKLTKLGFHING